MKLNRLFLALPVALTLVNCDDSKKSSGDLELKTFKDSISYMIGGNTGAQFKQALGDDASELFDLDVYEQGVRKGFTDSIEFSQAEMQSLMTRFQAELQKKQDAEMATKAAENKKKEDEFLAANAKKEGVVTTESGLQYKVLTEGTGAVPTAEDQVSVNYEGKLIDGTVFDSSYERGQPATFGVTQVIAGWTEALQLMKVGAKYQLYIPASLAYGERGSQPNIGPGEPLIFDVELLEIVKE